MSSEPSQFIVPQYFAESEGFESGSGSASASASASTPIMEAEPEIAPEISASDENVAELAAALESVSVGDVVPTGAGVVDSILGFFAGIVSLIKYIFRSLSDGIGISEFQFGYIVLGLGALFMTLPLWGEPRFTQGPLPRNSRIPTTYMPVQNNRNNNTATLQPQVE